MNPSDQQHPRQTEHQTKSRTSAATPIPRLARGRRNRFFDADGVDELLSMVMELTAEVATLRERMHVTERVLESHGLEMSDAINHYALTERDEQVLTQERQRVLSTVFRTLETASSSAGGAVSAQPEAEVAASPRPASPRAA